MQGRGQRFEPVTVHMKYNVGSLVYDRMYDRLGCIISAEVTSNGNIYFVNWFSGRWENDAFHEDTVKNLISAYNRFAKSLNL